MFGALESGMLGEEFVAYEVQVAQKFITCIAATGISSEVKQKRNTLVAIMLCNTACEPPRTSPGNTPNPSDVCPKIDNEQIE
jgi:hypothetical protein